jgi:putative ABC transport system substrate-binding protein
MRNGVKLTLVLALALSIVAVPLAADAQQAAKVRRIGYLPPRPGPSFYDEAFRKGLRDLGYVEGQNIAIEYRWANWSSDRLAAFAAKLARLKVEVIVSTGGSAPTLAAKEATRVIPIAFVTGDPVGLGLVPSLSRPGGNLTGINILTTELNAKRLDLLKEALPRASRIGVLANPGPPSIQKFTERPGDGGQVFGRAAIHQGGPGSERARHCILHDG